jgi:hypothetical protein
MAGYTHPAARDVAEHVRAALAGQVGAAGTGTLPEASVVASAIDVAFWGSLRREEGSSPRVTLAFLSSADATEPLVFHEPLPLGATALARLAPAVEHPGVHLGVARMNGLAPGLGIWGMTRHLRPYVLVLEVVAPGLLVLKYSPSDGGKFVNLVVLEGDEVRFLDHGAIPRPEQPASTGHVAARQFGLDEPSRWWAPLAETLVELAVAMRSHGRGGTLLVVPRDTDGWHASLMRGNPYYIARGGRLLAGDPLPAGELSAEEIAAVAGLTAVDGATVLDDACRVLVFGAKIVRRRGSAQVRRALLSQPIARGAPEVVALSQLGGTRHLTAAQFVADQPNALALVASQDGRFTVFRWLEETGSVGARRVDLLLI